MLDSVCGHYSRSTPSASTNVYDDKAKSRLFVENIESITILLSFVINLYSINLPK
jgi:hypothetical protein